MSLGELSGGNVRGGSVQGEMSVSRLDTMPQRVRHDGRTEMPYQYRRVTLTRDKTARGKYLCQFETHCEGDSHSSTTVNIILPVFVIKHKLSPSSCLLSTDGPPTTMLNSC